MAGTLTALNSEVDGNSAAIVEESETRANELEISASIQRVLAAANEVQAASYSVQTETVIRDRQASVERSELLQAEVEDNRAQLLSYQQAFADDFEALSQLLTSLNSEVEGNSAALIEEAQTRTTALEALASQINSLSAEVGDNNSTLTQQQQAFSDELEALASTLTALNSDVEGNSAALIEEAQTRTTALEALASQITQVQSSFEDTLADTQQSLTSQIEQVDGKTEANAQALLSAQSAFEGSLTTVQQQFNAQLTELDGELQATAELVQGVQTDLGNGLNAVEIRALANAGGLVANGQFSTGDLTGWDSAWDGIFVVKKDASSAYSARRNCPSEYMTQWPDSGWDTARSLRQPRFAVVEGESYSFRYSHATGGVGANIGLRFNIFWRDEDGATVSNQFVDTRNITSTEWQQTPVLTVRAPAGAVTAMPYLQRVDGGTGVLFLANVIGHRTDMVAGSLWTAQLQSNGLIGGFGLYNDGESVDAGFDVDRFWIGRNLEDRVAPFIVVDGQTVIDDALINKLLFTKLRSSDGSLVFENGKLQAKYIQANQIEVVWGQISGDKPAQNADRTSENTAYDTGRVAGTGAAQVRDWASLGQQAKVRADSWTRPTSTLINGNKIFTGDAYVDTLEIKGQAVTIPVAGQAGGQVDIPDGWVGIVSVAFISTGAPISISANAILQFSGSESGVAQMRLLINGQETWAATVMVHPGGFTNFAAPAYTVMRNTTPGSASVVLQVRRSGGNAQLSAFGRNITAIEVKR